jgi:hypothetical protein
MLANFLPPRVFSACARPDTANATDKTAETFILEIDDVI